MNNRPTAQISSRNNPNRRARRCWFQRSWKPPFAFWRRKAPSVSPRLGSRKRLVSASGRFTSTFRTMRPFSFVYKATNGARRMNSGERFWGTGNESRSLGCNLVRAFLHSEVEEAALRVAHEDTAPLYRDASEAQEIHAEGDRIVDTFMREDLSEVQDAARQVAGELTIMTMTAVGKGLSETPRTAAEIDVYANAMSDMFCGYLRDLEHGSIGNTPQMRSLRVAPYEEQGQLKP